MPTFSFRLCAASSLLLLTSMSACALGDGAARIKGSVMDERNVVYQDCRLELLSIDQKQVLDYRPIPSEFIVTFVVAPRPEPYRLRVACKSSDETFTSEPKVLGELKTSYDVPMDIGTVRLKRR